MAAFESFILSLITCYCWTSITINFKHNKEHQNFHVESTFELRLETRTQTRLTFVESFLVD